MSPGVSLEKTGIFLSKPIAFLLVLIYLLQSTLLVFMIKDKYELHKIIDYQRDRLTEMEEKLKIFKVIEDFQIGFTEDEKKQLANVIFEESAKYNYDPLLIMSVIITETTFKKGQVSHVGARGIMQLMPSTGQDVAMRSGMQWIGSEQLFDPTTNVKLGTLYLFEQILKFKDVRKGIIAYNLGETRLRGRLRANKPLPSGYFRKIWENYNMLKEKYDV
ncbi:MAG: lytic transglycosylase domain-containing protein [candidate division Zixibacteria bacterium]|nr:lytic transglycosylase domain-containing protein [candidate division Zixibacteria bacterium]